MAAKTNTERTITVRGAGQVSARPDLIIIEINLSTTRPNYAATLEHAAAEIEAMRSALVKVGHEAKALKTTDFKIETNYTRYLQNDEWKQRFAGYTCAHDLRLEFALDMAMLDKTLGAIASGKASPHFEISFSVQDPSAVKEQLLKSAVSNAAQKAQILAQAAGVKLGPIKQIDYSWAELRFSSETDFVVGSANAPRGLGMEIEPDEIKASDNVTIVWLIE
jgi:uncharacterized protein YggE